MVNRFTLFSLVLILSTFLSVESMSEPAVTYSTKESSKETPSKKEEVSNNEGAASEEGKNKEPEILSKEEALTITDTDAVIGNEDAPVTIFEYASMSCGHCSAFFNSTFDPLKEKYIDTGKVKFVFRDHPLDEFALRGAMLTKCAYTKGFDNFLRFKRVLFTTQSNWAGKRNYLEVLSNIAKLGGMGKEEFDKCVNDKDIENNILEKRLQTAKSLSVRSTPTFFINGEMVAGAKNLNFMSKIIDSYLEDIEDNEEEVK